MKNTYVHPRIQWMARRINKQKHSKALIINMMKTSHTGNVLSATRGQNTPGVQRTNSRLPMGSCAGCRERGFKHTHRRFLNSNSRLFKWDKIIHGQLSYTKTTLKEAPLAKKNMRAETGNFPKTDTHWKWWRRSCKCKVVLFLVLHTLEGDWPLQIHMKLSGHIQQEMKPNCVSPQYENGPVQENESFS